MAYERKEIYDVDVFLALVELNHTKDDVVLLDGDAIKLGSDRYKTFKFHGTDCVSCDAKGVFFAKERIKTKKPPLINTWHLNLYAVRSNGEMVLMTKDHIMPRSKGGKDELDNYQPMCELCNVEKGSTYEK